MQASSFVKSLDVGRQKTVVIARLVKTSSFIKKSELRVSSFKAEWCNSKNTIFMNFSKPKEHHFYFHQDNSLSVQQ